MLPELGEEEINSVVSVLKSSWLVMGEITEKFELSFAKKLNVKHAIAVTNGTAALHLANVALGITSGDEVICPVLTFIASANASRYTGASVVFANAVSPEDLTVDCKDIENKITSRTKAITVVHYAGFSCDMEKVLAIAKKYNLYIVEDCAHAPCVKYKYSTGKEEQLGTIGDIGCFSFFGNKNITTGEGGMLTTNNDELASKLRALRSHGMNVLSYDKIKGHRSNYGISCLGYNYRIDDIRSAIGLAQLEKVDQINNTRRNLVSLYRKYLVKKDNIIIPFLQKDLNYSSCHIMPIFVTSGREEVVSNLTKAGIQTSRHYTAIVDFSLYKDPFFYKNMEYDNLLTLPLFTSMTEDQIRYISSFV